MKTVKFPSPLGNSPGAPVYAYGYGQIWPTPVPRLPYRPTFISGYYGKLTCGYQTETAGLRPGT